MLAEGLVAEEGAVLLLLAVLEILDGLDVLFLHLEELLGQVGGLLLCFLGLVFGLLLALFGELELDAHVVDLLVELIDLRFGCLVGGSGGGRLLSEAF